MTTHRPNKKRAREWEEWLKGDTSILDNLNGVMAVVKPQGSTSADIVQKAKTAPSPKTTRPLQNKLGRQKY